MFEIYIGDMMLPVAPPKIETEIENKNTTVTLINDGDIVIPKHRGLMTISMDIVLPNHQYPFAVYNNGFIPAMDFINYFNDLKTNKEAVPVVISRVYQNGTVINQKGGSIRMTLEDYKWTDDTDEGDDNPVSLTLKEAPTWGTTVGKIKTKKTKSGKKKTTVKKTKSRAKKSTKKSTYKVQPGDSYWKIAKKKYGDGSLWKTIKKANGNKSVIHPNDKLVIPARSSAA